MMDWLPEPSDFRRDLRQSLEMASSADRLHALARLAQHKLGFLETILLDRALGRLSVERVPGFSNVRLAILGAATVDHLAAPIRVAGLRRNLLMEVRAGAYGQYRQELLDSASPLHTFRPQIVLLSLTARAAIDGVPVTATADEANATLGRAIDEMRVLWTKAQEAFNATVIQQTFLNVAEPLFGSHDRVVSGAPARQIARLNDQLAEAASAHAVSILDLARRSERDGLNAWFDATRWLQGKFEIAPQAAPMYGELVARVVGAERGLSKKCLVLDLDNTLWGGVVGDDGLDGIVLGDGSAVGEAHVALQRYAAQLRDRGVILAVCSKNDPAIAEAVFHHHPEMVLKRSDIAAFCANWDDKPENLEVIAHQLNIGLDSLVFVDDNPAERARVRESLPMVAVPEMPGDVAQYVGCLADAGYFEAVAFTPEDRQRSDQYVANASRTDAQKSAPSLDAFLAGLEMSVIFGPFQAVDLNRVTQLINKTNQFNPTTRRLTAQDVSWFLATGRDLTLQFRLVDRFGDNGLVSAMILRPDPNVPDLFEIDTWVMSCRVFGRQLEMEVMNIAVEAARLRGARAFRGVYIPTAKNGVVSGLYPRLGFSADPRPLATSGASGWLMCLADYVPLGTHINRKPEVSVG